ncbi:MAG: hypothetical protein H6892_06955 [Brucellaceae bacterium]|nr:hypothetical protein [Brucellaceae bacterium]
MRLQATAAHCRSTSTGEMSVVATMRGEEVVTVAVLRTARKLFDGVVFG